MAELSTLARPYAKAAFEYAAASNELKGWSESLAVIAVVAQQGKVEKLLSSPTYTAEQQAQQLMDVCGESLSEAGRNFISVLAENRRLNALGDMISAFQTIASAQRGEVTAEVASAHPLSDDQLATLKDKLTAREGRTVKLKPSVDPDLLGGLVVTIGSQRIDGSIRTRLNSLANAMKG